MRSRTSGFRRGWVGAALAAITAVLIAGCGSVEGGTLTKPPNPIDLSDQTYTVGGKSSDEHLVLCELAVATLKSVGAEVQERCNLGDAEANRNALVRGDIDMYWENTGTAWVSFLQQQPIQGPSPQYRAVQKQDREQNQIVWLEPTWFNPTDAFAVKKERVAELGVKSLSDMAAYLQSGRPGNVCIDPGYQNRDFGLQGLQQTYGFQVPPDRLRVMQDGIYQATAEGQQCLFGQVSPADARIPQLGLTVLRDDKKYHPPYNAAISIRQDAYDRNPDIARAFAPIAHNFTNGVMAHLKRQMSEDGKSAREVARDWLGRMGFIGS